MRTNARSSAGALALTILLAACGGAGTATTPSASSHATSARQNATLHITIPAKVKTGTAKHAQWVSPNVQSLQTIWYDTNGNQANYQPVNLTATSPGCSVVSGATQCNVELDLPIGTDSFYVTLYDQTQASGNVVGHSTGTATVVAGQVNTVNVVVDGVATRYNVAITGQPTTGTPGGVPVTITAYDADGNIIVGNASSDCATCNFLEFDLVDANKEYTLMQNGEPMQKDPTYGYYILAIDASIGEITSGVTLQYNGGAPETLTLNAHNGTSTQPVTLTTKTATTTPSYLAVATGGTIQAYSGSTGDTAPYNPDYGIFTIGSFISNGPAGCAQSNAPIALDKNNDLVSLQETCADSSNTAAYAAFNLTSTTPVWSVTGVPSGSPGTGPNIGMGFDANGYMYVAGFMGSYSPNGGATTYQQSTCVGVWKPGVSGTFNQSTMIDHEIGCNNGTRINQPIGGFAVAKDGTVYIDTAYNQTTEGILIYAPGTTDPSAYTGVLTSTGSTLATVKGLAVDSSGNLYAANWGNNSIAIFGQGATGTAAPIATISGSNTLLCGPHAIAVDSFGNIYVENSSSANLQANQCTNAVSGSGSVTVYPAGSNGNVAPSRVYALGYNVDGTYNGIALIP